MRHFACHLSKCTRGKIGWSWSDLSSQSVDSGGKKPKDLFPHTHLTLSSLKKPLIYRFLAQVWVLAFLIEANMLHVG